MKKKISIVGGGFTGVITAIYLCDNYDVTIYEFGNNLGGILKDIDSEKVFFLKGCQYLNTKSDWYSKISDIVKEELDIFDFTYHSYTEYFNEAKTVSNKFECPIIPSTSLIRNNRSNNNSLSDRFNMYDEKVSIYLKNLIKKFNINPENLIFDNAINFQLDRITSNQALEKIKKLKENKKYDKIFALDSKKLKIFHKAALPINGYNKIFEKLTDYLISKKVKIICGKKIFPIWENNKLKLSRDKSLLPDDLIIWTANPVALIYKYFSKPLESKNFRVKQINYEYEGNHFKNIYIQVFSEKTPIFRIFLYKLSAILGHNSYIEKRKC